VKLGVNLILVVRLSLMIRKNCFVVNPSVVIPLDLPLSDALVSHLGYFIFGDSFEGYVIFSGGFLR
jgi:hypothetical protein